MAKITAAIKERYSEGRKTTRPAGEPARRPGPTVPGTSTHGIYFASKNARRHAENWYITDTTAGAQEPSRREKTGFFRGVENKICQVLFAKSREAAELTNAVTINSVNTVASA